MGFTDPLIEHYVVAHSTPEHPFLTGVIDDTTERFADRSGMLVGHLAGRFLAMIVAATGAERILEIGTFTGYSALCMASALGPDGTVITCEADPHHADVARANVAASPWSDRVDIRLGPAIDTIHSLEGTFDLVFIDADKTGYDAYYEAVLPKLSDRGIIAIDNVLWSGRVANDDSDDDSTAALKALNAKIAADDRVVAVMLPMRDGITLVRRR